MNKVRQIQHLSTYLEWSVLACCPGAPFHNQVSGFVLSTHAMSLCKMAVQAMQGNEAMTQQAVTWQMPRGPKHRLRTKGTASPITA